MVAWCTEFLNSVPNIDPPAAFCLYGILAWTLVCSANNVCLCAVRLCFALLPTPLQALAYLAAFVAVASAILYIKTSYFSRILALLVVGTTLQVLKIACGQGCVFRAVMMMLKAAVPDHRWSF